VHHLTTKLPSQTIQAWEHSLGSTKKIPTFSTLESFLNKLSTLFRFDLIEGRKIKQSSRQIQGVNGFQRNVVKHSGNSHNNQQSLTASRNTTHLISASASHSTLYTMILATALVRLHNSATGQSAFVRALIDPGSEGTLVTENVVQALGLHQCPVSAEISGVGGYSTNRCKYRTEFTLSSTTNSGFKMCVVIAFVLRTVRTQRYST